MSTTTQRIGPDSQGASLAAGRAAEEKDSQQAQGANGGSHDLVKSSSVLGLLDQAKAMLADLRTVREVKGLRDKAQAFQHWLKQRGGSLEAQQDASEMKLRSERKLGEMLAETTRAGNPQLLHDEIIGRLPEGITLIQSHRWQRVWLVCEEEFERYIAGARQSETPITTSGILKIAALEAAEKARAKKRKAGPRVIEGERWRIERADCLDFLARQPEKSIDLLLTSPPYEDARRYQEGGQNLGVARSTDQWVEWMVEVFKGSLRCCKGLVAFVVAGRTKNYQWSASPALLMAALHNAGICLRCPPIYRRVGIPGSGGPDWLRNDYEWVICATNGGILPWSDNTTMGQPPKYAPGGDPTHRTQNGQRVNDPVGYAPMSERENEGPHRARRRAGRVYQPPDLANPGNVIDCVVGGGAMGSKLCHENEAPFPERLAEFFIRSFCPPGGLVCDPFAGSGTTLAVAVKQGRVATGCDLRDSQVKIVKRRISDITPPLFTNED
jgi:hypothetical protein